jgi:phosphonate transport system substrate-binding protein
MERLMKMVFRLCFALAMTAACATASAPANKVVVTQLPPLSIGIASYGGEEIAREDAQALQLYLTQKLGREVTAKTFASQGDLATAVAEGKVDLAWLPPFAFVDAQGKGKVTPLAKAVRHGMPFYRGVLFSKTSSKADSLKTLSGTKVAWVAKGSAAGYLFPRATIVQSGQKPEFKQENFVGDHTHVCKAVLDGEADVGATFADDRPNGEPMQIDGCVQALGKDAVKDLRIISVSAPIPNDVIAARPELPADDANRIRQFFLSIGGSSDDQKVLKDVFKADKFVEVGEDDFEPVKYAAEAAH